MQTIFGLTPDAGAAVREPRAAAAAEGAQNPCRPAGQPQKGPQAPRTDEYVPEEQPQPTGRYWLGRDEEGRPVIRTDDPAQNARLPQAGRSPAAPEAAGQAEPPQEEAADGEKGSREARCTCDTGRVDREIEGLKRKKEQLERQIDAAQDAGRREKLQKQLAQLEQELCQQDKDAYRREHAEYRGG